MFMTELFRQGGAPEEEYWDFVSMPYNTMPHLHECYVYDFPKYELSSYDCVCQEYVVMDTYTGSYNSQNTIELIFL